MQIHCIVEIGYEYNDEYYREPESGGGTPTVAYKVKAHADEACKTKNAERLAKGYEMRDGDDDVITEFYKVVTLEVADEDVQSYASAQERIKAAREEAQRLARQAFTDESAKLFAAHPDLQSFAWRQYTPYFNDGDECRFGVRCDEPDVNGQSGGELDSGVEYGRAPTYTRKQVRPPSAEYLLQEPVAKFLNVFADEDMKAMFGDHVKVTVYRGGKVEVDDYEHD